jgi:hypothetical protein
MSASDVVFWTLVFAGIEAVAIAGIIGLAAWDFGRSRDRISALRREIEAGRQ